MAKIMFSDGPNAGKSKEPLNPNLVIGRRDDCDMVIDDALASGHHARITQQDEQWTLSDLNSTNGTLLNNAPVHTSALNDGDVIQIGQLHLLFKLDGEAVPAVTAGPEPEDHAPTAGPEPEAPAATAGPEPEDRAAAPAASAPGVTPATDADLALVEQMRTNMDTIRQEVGKVIIGQLDVLNQVLMCMIAGGHALLIGLPGMGKTLMVSTIAKVLDMNFKRIQFTPDLMPTDITGTEILETNKTTNDKEFRFMRGPIFCNLLLADEINRTPPKTQAALLEAMQEKRVTVGATTYTLDEPFFVLATQNPIEQEGTYPLPEAQMDHFMFNIWVDYPQEHEEEQIVSTTTVTHKAKPEKVLGKDQVIQLQQVVRKVPVSEHVIKYAIRLVRATRPKYEGSPDFIKEYVSIGAGPRAGQYLILAAKALAVLEGRIHVSCNDIIHASIPVLRHRMYTNFAADSEGLTAMDLIKKLIEAVEQPSESDYPS